MKNYYPSYYSSFYCLADKCPDSCCKSWEIVIDEETQKKYSLLNNEFSDKIKRCLNKNEDGEVCFLMKDSRCPFLNTSGLCDIHLNLGEEYTSNICRQHPRFIEEYDGFSEISLSLSCPKAATLIFSCNDGNNTYPSPEYCGDDDVLIELIDSRKKILDYSGDFSLLQAMLLNIAADDQLMLDMTYIQQHPYIGIDFINDYLDLLMNGCEILLPQWENLLENTVKSDVTIERLKEYIISNNDSICKAFKYFLYRYYLKAINDLDIYSRALFIIMSCITSACIAISNSVTFEEAVRLYSKEIEHCTDNIDMILDFFYEL
ncbi:MAG: hypothetical protein E7573_00355 [Ruminococcaceae bacterium]|nr:hypothetical protein [Oscillospiraceae bacterium]